MHAILDQIIAFLSSAEGASASLMVVGIFLMKVFPKLRALNVVSPILRKSGQILIGAANVIDSVLPKEVPAPSEAPKA